MKMIKLKLSYFFLSLLLATSQTKTTAQKQSIELDHKISTIAKDNDKPVKIKRKEKGERPK